ncbi:MAG: outer membrane beta-barrel protein [Bacteroidetes bacterium]|nr:outer membrane beta-barrel protein [Bacteroidota bacterium]
MQNKFFKSILTTYLAVICTTISYSKGIELGIQGGPTVTKSFGKTIFKPSADIRYATEIYVKYNFTSKIGIRTGLGFEDKGFLDKDVYFTDFQGNIIGTGNIENHSQYITIPILAEFTFGKKVLPFFNTGLYLGILAKSQDITKFDDKTIFKSEATQYYKRADIGFVIGFGFKVPIKTKFLLITEIRNNIGTLNTIGEKFYHEGKYNKFNYSSALNIGFAYKFGSKEVATK